MTRFLTGLLAAFTLACGPVCAQTTIPFTGSFALPPQAPAVDYGPSFVTLNAKLDAITAAIGKLGTVTPPVVVPPPGPVTIPPALALKDFTGWKIAQGDYSQQVSPSFWTNGSSRVPFVAANVKVIGPDIVLTANDTGAAEINWNVDVITVGAVTMDAEITPMVSGYITAPLWLYENNGHGELDIELIGTKGVQFNVNNAGVYNLKPILIAGDFSGRHVWRIEYQGGVSAKFFMDGTLMATILPSDLRMSYAATVNGKAYKLNDPCPELFPKVGLHPAASNWNTANTGWAGQFVPGKSVVLTLHAYQRNKVS